MLPTWIKEGKTRENWGHKAEFNSSRKLEMEKLERIWKKEKKLVHCSF